MSVSIHDEVMRNGFAFMPEYQCGKSCAEIACNLGHVLSLGDGEPVHRLVVKSTSEAPPNTYGGIYGENQFPLHTDLAHWEIPPRFLLLRCLKGFKEVHTLLVDSRQVLEHLGREFLGRALVKPRRPINHKIRLLRIFQSFAEQRDLFRWDEVFLKPSGTTGREAMSAVKNLLQILSPSVVLLLNPGDTLVVDNWRMLHGRSRVPRGCEPRCIERAYLGGLH